MYDIMGESDFDKRTCDLKTILAVVREFEEKKRLTSILYRH